MKYVPLIWAAIRRKPARAILTLLSVSIAFLLFGMTVGLNARYRDQLANSRQDRVLVQARYGSPMTAGMVEQIKTMPGVKKIGVMGFAGGYYRDPKVPAFAQMIDKGMQEVRPELPLTPAQFDKLWKSRTGIFVSKNMAERLKVKAGDPLPITSPFPPRADGSKAWAFTVTEVFDESAMPNPPPMGFAIGNYTFFDEARVPAMRGNVGGIQLLATSADIAEQVATDIDKRFKNSPTPTLSVTERAVYEFNAQAGVDIIGVTQSVAAAGLFMILFLTGNSIAQSVRERIPEFAAMKTIGFSDTGVMALVFAEAVVPCLFGAAIGIGLAAGSTVWLQKMVPTNPALSQILPVFTMSVLLLAFAIAAAVAFASAVIPALRIKRLSVAAALSGR